LLPGSGCAGIGAVMTGVRSALRSQWRHAYLNRACCSIEVSARQCRLELAGYESDDRVHLFF
jgi:hypothetical protein